MLFPLGEKLWDLSGLNFFVSISILISVFMMICQMVDY